MVRWFGRLAARPRMIELVLTDRAPGFSAEAHRNEDRRVLRDRLRYAWDDHFVSRDLAVLCVRASEAGYALLIRTDLPVLHRPLAD
jgi:hypothetical protein